MTHQILRLPAVIAATGLPRSSVYSLIATGQFPQGIKLGVRAVGWPAADVDDWIEQRIAASRGKKAGGVR